MPCNEPERRHLLDLLNPEGPPTYLFEIAPEPLGTCPIHGDYWTEDCTRCDWSPAPALPGGPDA